MSQKKSKEKKKKIYYTIHPNEAIYENINNTRYHSLWESKDEETINVTADNPRQIEIKCAYTPSVNDLIRIYSTRNDAFIPHRAIEIIQKSNLDDNDINDDEKHFTFGFFPTESYDDNGNNILGISSPDLELNASFRNNTYRLEYETYMQNHHITQINNFIGSCNVGVLQGRRPCVTAYTSFNYHLILSRLTNKGFNCTSSICSIVPEYNPPDILVSSFMNRPVLLNKKRSKPQKTHKKGKKRKKPKKSNKY